MNEKGNDRGFEKRLNEVIYGTLNGHRVFNVSQKTIEFGCMV